MNYPDDYKASNNPYEQPGPEDVCPEALAYLEGIHVFYRNLLGAIVDNCINLKLIPTLHNLQVMMEGIGEGMADNADDALSKLKDHGFSCYSYTPEDSEALIAKAHEKIIDHFRIKPINATQLVEQMRDQMICAAKNERRLTRPEEVVV